MQCNRAMSWQPDFSKVFKAMSISWILDAPVDRTTGFLFAAIFRNKGILVMSDDAILKKGTRGFRYSMGVYLH